MCQGNFQLQYREWPLGETERGWALSLYPVSWYIHELSRQCHSSSEHHRPRWCPKAAGSLKHSIHDLKTDINRPTAELRVLSHFLLQQLSIKPHTQQILPRKYSFSSQTQAFRSWRSLSECSSSSSSSFSSPTLLWLQRSSVATVTGTKTTVRGRTARRLASVMYQRDSNPRPR